MQFVSDPPIPVKIGKMKERVRWQDRLITERGIDQTQLVLDSGFPDSPEFSFLVIGDSGSGAHGGYNPQRRIAEMMSKHREDCRFVLHTGDVIYLVGSSEYYLQNFIQPYQEFLVGGDRPKSITYDKMVFNLPFLPVPGNHDYYDLPLIYGILAQAALPLRRLLNSKLDFDVGWHGSDQGNAYAKAFLDYLKALVWPSQLESHLDRHYNAQTATGRCLRYEPGRFTRLPNRYYTFRCGGIDFFALDSNTFNTPLPLPATKAGDAYRQQLETRKQELEREKMQLLDSSTRLNRDRSEDLEQLDDVRTKIAQIDEQRLDIDKQLTSSGEKSATDWEQLDWLQKRLIESWHSSEVRGRVIYLHHPPYVTEATKWNQAQTLAIRHRLRLVLNQVADTVAELAQGRSVVDLVLSGHAHCLEYLRTGDTGHADAHTPWLVCGGSGHSLRRQRPEGALLMEVEEVRGDREMQPHRGSRPVATSKLFVGRNGQGSRKRRPYSGLRIDVFEGCPPKFQVKPLIAERFRGEWHHNYIEPFII
ncbi:MAG: metallophosphoesterase [Actinomycetota bacterium]